MTKPLPLNIPIHNQNPGRFNSIAMGVMFKQIPFYMIGQYNKITPTPLSFAAARLYQPVREYKNLVYEQIIDDRKR